jgi:hypothetical protein
MNNVMMIVGYLVCAPCGIAIAAILWCWAYEKVAHWLKWNRLLVRMLFYPTQRKLAAEVERLENAQERCIDLQSKMWQYQKAIVHVVRHHPSEAVRKLACQCCDYPDDEQWKPLAAALGLEQEDGR